MDKNITYIVTGCTGYVGNCMTKKLMEEGCRVIGMARSEEKVKKVFGDNAPEIVYGDIRNVEDIEKLFVGEGPFAVIHTAAMVTIGEGSEEELIDVTVGGTKKVVDACVKHNVVKLLHIGSSEAIPKGWFPEEEFKYVPDPEKARKGYPKAKSMADKVVLDAVKEHDLDASILMIAGVLGPGDYTITHMTQMFIDYINESLPASIDAGYNDFDIRDLTDVLPAIFEKAEKGETYLFANRPDKIDECLSIISDMTGCKRISTLPVWIAYVGLPFLWLQSKLTGKRPLYTAAALSSLRERVDFPLEKSKKLFGYNTRPLEETVRDHVQFLIDNGYVQVKEK